MAQARAQDAEIPSTRCRSADAGSARLRVVFLSMAVLFLIQPLLAAASQHY
jgi:hypothetical protein